MQRLFDVFFSSLALIILLPVFLPIMTLLRFSGEGEVFFLQPRVGEGGKYFMLWKFATMIKNSPNLGHGTVTVKDDPRILPVGSFLRKTKINELPQLWNVLCGDMSFVGPRPQTERCFDAFPEDLKKVITEMKPGLSGIGPIIFRKEEEILSNQPNLSDFYDNILAPYKGKIEAWYKGRQTIYIYFIIILITIWVVLFPSSRIAWRMFSSLPVPPDELKNSLNYLE